VRVLAALLASAALAAPASAAEIRAIEDPGGAQMWGVMAVNDSGVVAARTVSGSAVRWQNGTNTILTSPDGGTVMPHDINDSGAVVGTHVQSGGPGLLWPAGSTTYTPLVGLPGVLVGETMNASGLGINNAGTVVGLSYRRRSVAAGFGTQNQAVKWDPGVENLHDVDEDWQATDINSTGSILISQVSGSRRALLRSGGLTEIDCLNSAGTNTLNDDDVVVGSGAGIPRRWVNGTCTPLALPPDHTAGSAAAINNNGVSVGVTRVGFGAGQAVMWSPTGQVTKLNDLLPAGSGWTLSDAIDINDNGQVLGVGSHNGEPRHFLLTPDSSLAADLAANWIDGTDMLSVGLTVTNPRDEAAGSLTFPSATGIVKSGPLGLRAFFGPLPGYPGTLAGESESNHAIGFEVTSPGSALLMTRVKGTVAGVQQTADAAVRVTAVPRGMTDFEYDASVAGGFVALLDQVARGREAAITELSEAVRKQIKQKGGKSAKGLLKADKQEQALAHQHGLPPKTFAMLQKHMNQRLTPAKPGYQELAMIFAAEGSDSFFRSVGKTMDKVGEKTFGTPAAFWRDFLFNSKDGDWIKVGHELGAMSREGLVKGAGYLGTAGEFYMNPGTSSAELWREVPKIYNETATAIKTKVNEAEYKAIKWDDLMEKNPREGMKQFAKFFGEIEAAAVNNAIENFFDPVERLQGLNDFRKAQKAMGKAGDASDAAPLTRRAANLDVHGSAPGGKVPGVKGARVLAKNGDVAESPLPGLGNMTPEQLDYVSRELRRINQKFDVDLELQIRPVNAYSANIKGGIGKVEAIPTKNLKPEDVQLGAPAEWLGQPAYFKPTLPKNFKKLPEPEQRTLQLRFDEKLDEYLMFTGKKADPTGKADKVKKMLKAGGAEVELGQAYKGKIQLETKQKGGATLIQYKKLEVNGRPVFDPKKGPRPIVSDFDMNALIDKRSGRHLPAGIRGQIELEVMNFMSKAQYEGLIPFGFHGWTHSGFDLKSGDFRHVAKHMLMYASDAEALKFARRWAPQFFPELGKIADPRKHEREYRKAVEKILAGYERGKHLVQITAAEAVFGPGINPSVGLPLP